MQNRQRAKSWAWLTLLVTWIWIPLLAQANPQMEKAIKHFKDFEIKQGLKLFQQLENDGSLSQAQKAKVSLYMGMSYAYLRNRARSIEYFSKAVQQDASIQLPKGTPSRLRKLFDQAKASGGTGGTSSPPPAPVARPAPVDPRPVDTPSITPPEPAARRTAPPPRRRMSFGGFSMRRTTPPPRSEPLPPPTRREASPPLDTPPPTARKRRVAQADPTLGDPTDPSITRTSKPKSRGNALWISAWVTGGLAVAMAGVGFAMGALASSQAGLASNPQTFQVDIPDIQKDAQRSALIANIMFIGAGAAAITSVVLFIVSSRGSARPKKRVDALSRHNSTPPTLSNATAPANTFELLSTP